VGGGASWYGPASVINSLITIPINAIAATAITIHVTIHSLRRVSIENFSATPSVQRIVSRPGAAKRVT
jgi:hypothetical protein